MAYLETNIESESDLGFDIHVTKWNKFIAQLFFSLSNESATPSRNLPLTPVYAPTSWDSRNVLKWPLIWLPDFFLGVKNGCFGQIAENRHPDARESAAVYNGFAILAKEATSQKIF